MAKILVVEDDEAYSDVIEGWLSDEAYEVEAVNDGFQARKKMQLNRYDVIILDWNLPGVAGVELCREYRASGGAALILMLTGQTAIERREEGLDAGADDYLTKPFHLKELSARLRALLRRPPIISTRGDGAHSQDATRAKVGFEAEAKERVIGMVLDDRHEIVSFIGEGGESVVYEGRHRLIGKRVAIKFLRSRFRYDERRVQRFQKEGQASCKLNHPNIITVLDYGLVSEGQPYIVMEYLEGETLAQKLDRDASVPVSRFFEHIIQVCDGLQHAHEHGLIHRDLKPSNIMIIPAAEGKEHVKIVDFGMVMILPTGDEAVQRLTQAGEFVGTAYYMSPEQCRGNELDVRSDIYSLGCLMYEALTGLPPFLGQDLLETMHMHMYDAPRPFSKVRSDIVYPIRLEEIVRKAMNKAPKQRYQSVLELRRDLLNSQLL
jgi:CheY-like chemotaxis protein